MFRFKEEDETSELRNPNASSADTYHLGNILKTWQPIRFRTIPIPNLGTSKIALIRFSKTPEIDRDWKLDPPPMDSPRMRCMNCWPSRGLLFLFLLGLAPSEIARKRQTINAKLRIRDGAFVLYNRNAGRAPTLFNSPGRIQCVGENGNPS